MAENIESVPVFYNEDAKNLKYTKKKSKFPTQTAIKSKRLLKPCHLAACFKMSKLVLLRAKMSQRSEQLVLNAAIVANFQAKMKSSNTSTGQDTWTSKMWIFPNRFADSHQTIISLLLIFSYFFFFSLLLFYISLSYFLSISYFFLFLIFFLLLSFSYSIFCVPFSLKSDEEIANDSLLSNITKNLTSCLSFKIETTSENTKT
jgi:hypothetical protein